MEKIFLKCYSYTRKIDKEFWKNRYLFLLLLPIISWYIVFRYVPIAGSVIAFKDYKTALGIWGSPWAGLKYFKMLWKSPDLFRVLRNTVLISLYKLIFGFPVPIILALMLNEIRIIIYKKFVQTVIFIPYLISWVLYGGIIYFILSPSYGPINSIIKLFGYNPIFFLGSPKLFRAIIVITDVLKTSGWWAIIYLAAISGINPELYEAARTDGADKWQQIWHITIPGIIPTVVILLIIRIGYILNVGFEQVFVLYNPMVYEVGDVVETFTYRVGILEGRFSYTAGLGLLKSVFGFSLVLLANYLSRKVSEYGLW